MEKPKTLYDKIIDSHTVQLSATASQILLYVDRTVLNEYTSPQAFSGLREAGREVWNPSAALMVVDHVNPTAARRTRDMPDADAARQVEYFGENARDFGIELFDILDPRQGIEHVVAPEQGLVLPGMVIAAGDSHTTAYGALGALGFGIGTSRHRALSGDANAGLPPPEDDADHHRRRAAAGRHRQGCGDGGHPPHRRADGATRLCGRVRRRGHLGHERRRPDDRLHHDRRSRRARSRDRRRTRRCSTTSKAARERRRASSGRRPAGPGWLSATDPGAVFDREVTLAPKTSRRW